MGNPGSASFSRPAAREIKGLESDDENERMFEGGQVFVFLQVTVRFYQV